VHIFGNPADLPAIRSALGGRKVFVLEDAAQAVDATVGGKRVGSLADAGAFSFYPSKNLGAAGDGGIFTTNDDAMADLVGALREHGSTTKLYHHERIGKNSRMDEMQAAVVRRKLPSLAKWTALRQDVARRYAEGLAGIPEVRLPTTLPGATHVHHLYVVRVARRDDLATALRAQAIGSGVYYPVPLHQQPCFKKFGLASCPVSDRLATEALALPCFPGLRPEEQDRVIRAVKQFFGKK
jgi:dTDP-4-amino-4,6-dideoxygalactose transaminase